MNIYQRSTHLLALEHYSRANQEVVQISHRDVWPPAQEQYILRMMIRSPESNGLVIPTELDWLRETIMCLSQLQEAVLRRQPYVYVTVRNGEVQSVTDDEWHVDGFSMRVPHYPEQNWIWSDCYPTEQLVQNFEIPEDFDPMQHNLHTYFQDHADTGNVRALKVAHLAAIDPYIVHRRPQVPVGTKRCFFRISFVPIEIEDDTCTPNPLMPRRFYGRADIRNTLTRYHAK